MIDSISQQLGRTARLQEHLIAQVCDGDLSFHLRAQAEHLYGIADEVRQGLQALYVRAQS